MSMRRRLWTGCRLVGIDIQARMRYLGWMRMHMGFQMGVRVSMYAKPEPGGAPETASELLI